MYQLFTLMSYNLLEALELAKNTELGYVYVHLEYG